MPATPLLPRLLVCYEHGDTDAQAARLVADLRQLAGFDNVATCYDYGPYFLRHLLLHPTHPLALVVVVGPAVARPPQTEPTLRAQVVERVRFTIQSAHEGRRHVYTLMVAGAEQFYPQAMSGEQPFLDPRHPPVVVRDDRWAEDLAERLVTQLPPEFLEAPAAAPEGEPGPRPTAEELEEYLRIQHQQAQETLRSRSKQFDPNSLIRFGQSQRGQAPRAAAEDVTGPGQAGAVPEAGAPPLPSPAPPRPAPVPPRPAPVPRATASAQPPASDVVECTVFAPPEVKPGAAFLLQVFAHLTHEDAAVARLAKEADAEAEKRGSKALDAEVARGSRLTFHLRLPGMQVDDPVQHLTWRGEPEAVQFGVTAGAAHGSVIGTITVSQHDVPFGHVKFKLTVAGEAGGRRDDDARAEQRWARYRKAFISYASKDRDEVLKRVQMLARVRVEFFQDLLSLEPGERWERALYRHIDESDVFFLFWSKAARESEWVMREIRYALARRGGDELKPPEIVPVVIEGPPLVEPPPELDDLHFNDQFVYFINREGGTQ